MKAFTCLKNGLTDLTHVQSQVCILHFSQHMFLVFEKADVIKCFDLLLLIVFLKRKSANFALYLPWKGSSAVPRRHKLSLALVADIFTLLSDFIASLFVQIICSKGTRYFL